MLDWPKEEFGQDLEGTNEAEILLLKDSHEYSGRKTETLSESSLSLLPMSCSSS